MRKSVFQSLLLGVLALTSSAAFAAVTEYGQCMDSCDASYNACRDSNGSWCGTSAFFCKTDCGVMYLI